MERFKISLEDLNTLIKYSCSRFYNWVRCSVAIIVKNVRVGGLYVVT